MAAKLAIPPYTPIENSIINEHLHEIGPYGFTIYAVIKSYRNLKSKRCDPSYATIAEKAGIDRVTVIRHVKVLKSLNILDPQLRFKEDGSPATNQYNFSDAPPAPASEKKSAAAETLPAPSPVKQDKPDEGSCTAPPVVIAQNNHPGCSRETTGSCTEPPEQSSSLNKKERTREREASQPTEKQKTCQHPPDEIAFLTAENIRICHHCWLLLDDNLTLAGMHSAPISQETAFPECEALAEPEEKQPPVGETCLPTNTIMSKTASEAPLNMAFKSCQMPPEEEKRARRTNALVMLGTWLIGRLKSA